MYAVIEKLLGGLTPPCYLRRLYFALIFPLMLLTQVNHQPGGGGMFLLAVVNTLLYLYARFLYEQIWDFIMGDTKFMLGVLWVSLGELATMITRWRLAVSLAPISLVYLCYLRERTMQQRPTVCRSRKKSWTMPVKRLSSAPAGMSMYLYMRFAADDETIGDERYRSRTMADISPCLKHGYPTRDLELQVPSLYRSFGIITINLRVALAMLLDSEQLNLNPARWNRIRRDLSGGWCYTPWTGVKQKRASLADDRHHIVAIMKFSELEYAGSAI